MENREKLEIPVLEFTKVTLLEGEGASSNCDMKRGTDSNGGETWTQGCKEGIDPWVWLSNKNKD